MRSVPKPLIEVAGQPFLFHQLQLLADHGAKRVVVCVGYLGALIEDRVGDERFGLRIDYSYDAAGLDGTLGAIRRAIPLLSEPFLVLYGDTYLRLDYRAAAAGWQASALPAMMTVLRNDSRWEPSNAVYADGRVLAYDKHARTPDMRWIDYGLGGLAPDSPALVDPAERDLASLYRTLAAEGRLFGYEVAERFYEIGTPSGLAETDVFLRRVGARTSGSGAGEAPRA